MEFEIRKDIKIRAFSPALEKMHEYNYDDLSKAVGYFEDLINSQPQTEKHIGIVFGLLGFLQAAFMIALFKTGRTYDLFYYNSDDFPAYTKDYSSHIFLLGPWFGGMSNYIAEQKKDIEFDSKHTDIYSAETETLALSHGRPADLTVKFSNEQQVFVSLTGEHVRKPSLTYGTGYIEASSIRAAMDNYYHEDDDVVLFRACRHAGVATLSVFPALFKCAKVTLCKFEEEYKQEYHHATHIHAGFELIRDQWPLPARLRMLTTGGYPFNSDCINYVTSICDIENIVDCYGTSTFPPPMAIRHLSKDDKGMIPFKWVNEYVLPVFYNSGDGIKLIFKSTVPNGFTSEFNHTRWISVHHEPEYDTIGTNDNVEPLDDKTFYFYGSATNFIRIHHSRQSESDFKKYFTEKTGITEFLIEFVNKDGVNFPILRTSLSNKNTVMDFAKETELEMDFDFYDR